MLRRGTASTTRVVPGGSSLLDGVKCISHEAPRLTPVTSSPHLYRESKWLENFAPGG